MTHNKVKSLVITAMSIALCVVLPMVFHSFPNGGSIFCPMHIPVLLCGLACGWPWGLVAGLLGPVMSHLLGGGMPPIAVLPGMMVECAVYGAATGILLKHIHTGKNVADLYISLIGAMLLGRVLSGIAKALILAPGTTTLAAWATASFVTALPGIMLHLILVPALVASLTKARILQPRYREAIYE